MRRDFFERAPLPKRVTGELATAKQTTARPGLPVSGIGRGLLGAALTLGLLSACGSPGQSPNTGNGSLPTFSYDGQDHGWVSPDASNVSTLSLAPGDNALSSLGWTTASNGWGPIERNMSAGDVNGGDGRTLSLAGKTYPQGFGVHANSSMTFNIAAQCSTFSADIGLDDEVGSQGSVVFQVLADGTELYNSGTIKGGDPAKSLKVDISGKKELKLIVTDAGDGIDYDHADWAAPTLSCGTASALAQLPAELIFSTTQAAMSAPQTLTLHNTSNSPLSITALNFGGANASAFGLSGAPALPITLAAGQSADVKVDFSPQGAVGALQGSLQVVTDSGSTSLGLHGLSARGEQGDLEPPLQQIVNTLGYNINVGSSALILGTGSALMGDEVSAPMFQKAGSGPVIMRAVARYSPDDLLDFGYYVSGSSNLKTVGTVALKQDQSLNPALTPGSGSSFDPGSASFGFFAGRTSYANYPSYTDDSLNTGPTKHAARIYPLKDRAGVPIANSYLVAFEPSTNGDYNDYVFVVQNVKPLQKASVLRWTQQADAITAVSEAQGAVVGGKLYVFSGFDSDFNTTPKVQMYDPATNRWTTKRDIPEQLTHGAVAVDGQTVYIAGGFIGDHPGPQTTHVWKYDAPSDTWSAFTPLPASRGGGGMVLLGRTLHFVGGTIRNTSASDINPCGPANGGLYVRDTDDHWTLNLDSPTSSWQIAAPMPDPRNHLAAAALGGKLYVMGGQHLGDECNGNQSEVDMYDPATNTWSKRASLPKPVGHTNASTVVWNNKIVMVAGVTNNSEKIADVNEYDPDSDKWTALTPLPAPRQSPIAGIVNNRLIVTTGALQEGAFNTTWSGQR